MSDFRDVVLLLSVCTRLLPYILIPGVEATLSIDWHPIPLSRSHPEDLFEGENGGPGEPSPLVRTYRAPTNGFKYEPSRSDRKMSTIQLSHSREPSTTTEADQQRRGHGCHHNHEREQGEHRQETFIPQSQLPNMAFHFKINFGANWGQRVESGTSSDQRNSESSWSQPLIRQEFNFGSMPYPLRARQAEPHPEGHPHRHQAHHDESKTGQQGSRSRETNPKIDSLVDILGNNDL